MFTYTETLTIDTEMFEDVIYTAGGSISYWAFELTYHKEIGGITVKFDGDDFEDSDPLSTGCKSITYTDIGNAIIKIKNGDDVSDYLREQAVSWLHGEPTLDGDLADVIIQTAIFGEIVYG